MRSQGGSLFLAGFCLLIQIASASAQTPIRIAVVDFAGDSDGQIVSLLRETARNESAIELLDEELVRYAVRGARYEGSLNLSLDQARALGLSLGCDFFFLGKVQNTRRLESGEQFHFEALTGIFIVETRTGRLIHFAFLREQSKSEKDAFEGLKRSIKAGWPNYLKFIYAAYEKHITEIENVTVQRDPVVEVVPYSSASSQPVFFERLKPDYTEQAELAGITATVELQAVFGENGRIGQIEVVKWAGFGLDESAARTLLQLRFKPAERDGKVITICGLVRYNFGRWSPSQATPAQAGSPSNQSDIERLKRSLRSIKNAGKLPGKDP